MFVEKGRDEMISRAGINTNFGTGMGKVYGNAILEGPLDFEQQIKALSDTFQSIQAGGFKYMGNKYELLDHGDFAQLAPTEKRTGLHVLKNTSNNTIIMHKERDLETDAPASISILENNQDLRTVNNDEPRLGGYFTIAKNIIIDTCQQISERIQK